MENIVWTSTNEIVDKNFNYMIMNYYNHFNFKYNWNNTPKLKDYFKRLFINSFIENEEIRSDLPVLIHNVEDYFATGINERIFTKSNIITVYQRLRKNLKILGYTKSKNVYDSILVKEDLREYLKSNKDTELSPIEERELYIFREISKKILNVKDEDLINIYNNTLEKVIEEKNSKVELSVDKTLIKDGFEMIEDLLAQNFGEHLIYKYLEKDRPKFRVRFVNDYPLATNLEDRGLFQKPVLSLGKTLAGISSKSDNETLINMFKLDLELSLSEIIISEYKEGNAQKYYDLFILLQNFGVLYRENNNNESSIYRVDYKKVMDIIDKITSRNLGNNLLTISTLKPLNLDKYLNA